MWREEQKRREEKKIPEGAKQSSRRHFTTHNFLRFLLFRHFFVRWLRLREQTFDLQFFSKFYLIYKPFCKFLKNRKSLKINKIKLKNLCFIAKIYISSFSVKIVLKDTIKKLKKIFPAIFEKKHVSKSNSIFVIIFYSNPNKVFFLIYYIYDEKS